MNAKHKFFALLVIVPLLVLTGCATQAPQLTRDKSVFKPAQPNDELCLSFRNLWLAMLAALEATTEVTDPIAATRLKP